MLNQGIMISNAGMESMAEPEEPGHLTEGQLAGYLDGDLNPDERLWIDAHLDDCPVCRAELAAVARLAESSRAETPVAGSPGARVGRRWWPLLVGGALAAGLAAVMLFRPIDLGHGRQPVRAPDFREGRARLEIVSPAPDSAVAASSLVFTWRGSVSDLYRVTVLSESGEPLWTVDTADTVAALPASVGLEPGRSYFWRVEGIADGVVASTGVHRLRIAP
jgi:hypothetical protein